MAKNPPKAPAETEADLLDTPEAAAAPVAPPQGELSAQPTEGVNTPEPGSDAGEDLAGQLAAAKSELAEVTAAAETAIGELKAERDGLAADKARLEGEVADLADQIKHGTAEFDRLVEENIALREANPEAAERITRPEPEAAPAEPELHDGPYVVMKTSAVAGADGRLIARGRVATGERERLVALIEDDKARRALVREVEAAQAKETVAKLA